MEAAGQHSGSKDLIADVFLWMLRSFPEHLFHRMPSTSIRLPAKKIYKVELWTSVKLALKFSPEKPSLHDFVINLSPLFFLRLHKANYPLIFSGGIFRKDMIFRYKWLITKSNINKLGCNIFHLNLPGTKLFLETFQNTPKAPIKTTICYS